MKKVAIKKVAKKMIMRKELSCLVIIAILVSAVPISVFAVNDSNNSKGIASNRSNGNLLEKSFTENNSAEVLMPFLANNTIDMQHLAFNKTVNISNALNTTVEPVTLKDKEESKNNSVNITSNYQNKTMPRLTNDTNNLKHQSFNNTKNNILDEHTIVKQGTYKERVLFEKDIPIISVTHTLTQTSNGEWNTHNNWKYKIERKQAYSKIKGKIIEIDPIVITEVSDTEVMVIFKLENIRSARYNLDMCKGPALTTYYSKSVTIDEEESLILSTHATKWGDVYISGIDVNVDFAIYFLEYITGFIICTPSTETLIKIKEGIKDAAFPDKPMMAITMEEWAEETINFLKNHPEVLVEAAAECGMAITEGEALGEIPGVSQLMTIITSAKLIIKSLTCPAEEMLWIKLKKSEPEFTPLDLCMVLDRSGSMGESMGGKTKMQGVKEAAKGVVNVLLPQDRVSIVPFSDTATANIDLTSDFNAVKTKINAINADGRTSFGAGLEAALAQFKAHGNPDHTPAILFMSDGEHNRAPDPEAYVTQCKNKGIPIFTVGFASSESQVDVTKLKMMAEETGGEYHFVSEIFDLQNIFLRLQHKASGWESVAAYVGEVNEGETITAGTFYVDPAIEDLRVTLNWPGSNLDLKLFDPNGKQIDFGASNVIYSGDRKPEYVIIKDPQSGYWTAKVYGKSIGSSEEYYVLVTKYVPPTPPQPAICKVQITSNTALQDRPSIVYANGNYYVAYQSHEKGYGIYIKKFDSQWNFKKKVEVVSGSAYYDSPSLVYANNKLYVAYISNAKGASANDYDIIVKEYNPSSLSCTKGAKYLTSLQSCQDLPALLYKNGYFYLAYQSWETGNGDIYIKKFDSNWNQLKKVRVTSKSSLQDRPSLTYANGYFYVAYFSEETGYYDIFVKRLDSNLNLESWKKQITSKSSYQSYPFITFVNNQFAIVYASTETGTLGIYLKTYDSNWNFIEKTKVVDSSDNERRSSHTWDGSNFWVAYVYNYGDSKDWNIFAIIPGCKD